jgi:hypothetical protein
VKIKLKGRHFDTLEVIEAESQAMLNTLTEQDFQDAFKMAEALGTLRKGTTVRVIVATMPQVSS